VHNFYGSSETGGIAFDRSGRLHCVEATANRVVILDSPQQATDPTAFGGRDLSVLAGNDLDGGAYSAADLFYGGGQVIPSPGFHGNIPDSSIEMTTHEFQVLGDLFEEKLHYTLGVFFYEEEVFQDNPQQFSVPIQFVAPSDPGLLAGYTAAGFCNDVPGQGPVCIGSQRLPLPFPAPGADPNLNGAVDFTYGQKTESFAAYGQFTYELTEDLEVTAGLRYTDDERDAFLFNENLGQTDFSQRLRNDDSWDNISYLLNFNYAVNQDMNIYATWATGFNSGGFNARASTLSSWEDVVDEETVDSYELGLKADWFDSRLRTNVAIFYNEFTDIQISQFEAGTGGASNRLVNAGSAEYFGLELDAIAVLAEGLTLDLTYGYLDAEYDEYFALDPATNQEVDISGITTVPRSPEHTANIGIQYEFRPFTFGALSARLDANYTDEFTFHPFQNQFDSAQDRLLINARVSLNDVQLGDSGSLRISAWGKNLTDEEYEEWGIDFANLGFAGNVFGRVRTYGIDVLYNFAN